nr:unnamed protein product [Spirometra erinaceieuropaei]
MGERMHTLAPLIGDLTVKAVILLAYCWAVCFVVRRSRNTDRGSALCAGVAHRPLRRRGAPSFADSAPGNLLIYEQSDAAHSIGSDFSRYLDPPSLSYDDARSTG